MKVELLLTAKKIMPTEKTRQIAVFAELAGGWHALSFDHNIILKSGSDTTVIRSCGAESATLCISASADEFIHYLAEELTYLRRNDIRQAYGIISIAKLIGVSADCMRSLFAMFNWGGIEKGQKYLNCIDSCRQSLRSMLFSGKASLQAVQQFCDYFAETDYDAAVRHLQSLTFSETNRSLQFIVEIAKQRGDAAEALNMIEQHLADVPDSRIMDTLYHIRYPHRSSMERRFDEFVSRLKLRNRVCAPYLSERQQYTLSLSFRDCADLAKQLEAIRQKAVSISPDEDIFILDNLFAGESRTDKQDGK